MSEFDVVVIGAGNAGLTAAVTLQRGGARTLLVERHDVPGGCATSFRRGRFEFETALHQLSGVGEPGQEHSLRTLLADLGVADKLEFVHEPHLYRSVVPGVLDVTLPADWDGVADAVVEAFPGNRDRVAGFLELCRNVATWTMRAQAAGEAIRRPLRLFGADLLRHGLRPARHVLEEHFDDPRVAHVLAAYWQYFGQPPATMPFQDLAMLLHAYIEYKPYHLRGGSQMLSTALLEAYLAAGGQVRFHTAAQRIRVRDGRVRAVGLSNGEEVTTAHIVSNVSPLATYLGMLDPADVPDAVRAELAPQRIGVSAFAVHLGLDASAAELGFTSSTNFIGQTVGHDLGSSLHPATPARSIAATSYDVAPIGFAPPGASHVSLLALQYAEAWARLEPDDYRMRRFAYADTLLDLAERATPGIRDAIEEAEVATPVTFARYLGHPGGAIYGFDRDAAGSWLFREAAEYVGGLHFAGAWAGTSGFQPTLESGARVARRLLHRDPV